MKLTDKQQTEIQKLRQHMAISKSAKEKKQLQEQINKIVKND